LILPAIRYSLCPSLIIPQGLRRRLNTFLIKDFHRSRNRFRIFGCFQGRGEKKLFQVKKCDI
jgi:hypothetical protein